MNIVLGKENIKSVGEKYIVLELDTLLYPKSDEPVTAYCIVDSVIDVAGAQGMAEWMNLHEKLISNYKKGNFEFCTTALEHLPGKFNGELDTFYSDLRTRLVALSDSAAPADWTGVVEKV